jgi:lipopolysaccharide transport system ATP-binding protein
MNEAPGNDMIKLLRAEILINTMGDDTGNITVDTPFDMVFEFFAGAEVNLNLSLLLFTASGNCIFNVATRSKTVTAGIHKSTLSIPGKLLNDEIYSVNLLFVKDMSVHLFAIEDLLTFEVVENEREGNWFGKWQGAVRPDLEFSLT